MKQLILLSLFYLTTVSADNLPVSQGKPLQEGYYVTIAVYADSKESYAKNYVQTVMEMGYEADYGFSVKRNYYYVYTFYSKNYKEVIAQMHQLRTNEQFNDAWVYVHSGEIKNTLTTEEIKQIEEKDKALKEAVVGGLNEVYAERFEKVEKDSMANEEVEEETEVLVENDEVAPVYNKEEGLKLYFNVLNARTGDPIGGEVQIVDVERAKLLDAKESGDSVLLKDPNNGSGNLAFIVDNFGFRKNQLPFSYYEPDTSLPYIRKEGDHYVVDIEMIRYNKGDIATMYNVYFFQDAALMKPESKYELNSLLNMMQENPDYKIRIHGHTNGNATGKIISLGDSDNLFALTEKNKEGFGSAKKLSEERAEMVKRFLTDNGISPDRMEVKGWGGKQMIHEKFGHRARHNVRVEIEILEE